MAHLGTQIYVVTQHTYVIILSTQKICFATKPESWRGLWWLAANAHLPLSDGTLQRKNDLLVRRPNLLPATFHLAHRTSAAKK